MKGNYPFAVLHVYKTEGFNKAVEYAKKLAKETMTVNEGREYVRACIKTNGQPNLIDLFE